MDMAAGQTQSQAMIRSRCARTGGWALLVLVLTLTALGAGAQVAPSRTVFGTVRNAERGTDQRCGCTSEAEDPGHRGDAEPQRWEVCLFGGRARAIHRDRGEGGGGNCDGCAHRGGVRKGIDRPDDSARDEDGPKRGGGRDAICRRPELHDCGGDGLDGRRRSRLGHGAACERSSESRSDPPGAGRKCERGEAGNSRMEAEGNRTARCAGEGSHRFQRKSRAGSFLSRCSEESRGGSSAAGGVPRPSNGLCERTRPGTGSAGCGRVCRSARPCS